MGARIKPKTGRTYTEGMNPGDVGSLTGAGLPKTKQATLTPRTTMKCGGKVAKKKK
jgi:hypothetical protein